MHADPSCAQPCANTQPGLAVRDDIQAAWLQVAEACVLVAKKAPGFHDMAPLDAGVIDTIVAARALAQGAQSGGQCQDALFLRGAILTFDAVACGRARRWDSGGGLQSSLHQCGVVPRTPVEMDGAVGTATGRGLGQVLAWLHRARRHDDASAVAWRSLSAGGTATLLDAVVAMEGAGIPAMHGCIRCAEKWETAFKDRRLAPETVAWVAGGLRLALDGSSRQILDNLNFWSPDAFEKGVLDSLADSVRGFDEDGVKRYRRARRGVDEAVHAFNGRAVGAIWLSSERGLMMSMEVTHAIETAMKMGSVARRLAAGDGSVGRRRRV